MPDLRRSHQGAEMKCWPWAHHWHYKVITVNYDGCAKGETRTMGLTKDQKEAAVRAIDLVIQALEKHEERMSEYTCCWCGKVKLYYPSEQDSLYGG